MDQDEDKVRKEAHDETDEKPNDKALLRICYSSPVLLSKLCTLSGGKI
jgi:hypothetical protein